MKSRGNTDVKLITGIFTGFLPGLLLSGFVSANENIPSPSVKLLTNQLTLTAPEHYQLQPKGPIRVKENDAPAIGHLSSNTTQALFTFERPPLDDSDLEISVYLCSENHEKKGPCERKVMRGKAKEWKK